MPKRFALLFLASAATLLAMTPHEVEATHRTCHQPRDASVVQTGSRVVMWLQTNSGVFACHRRAARTRQLLGEYDKDGYWWSPERYAINADMAGVVVHYTDKYGSNNLEIRVRNARRGRRLDAYIYLSHTSKQPTVSGFVLTRFGSGAVAYSLPGEATRIEAFWPVRDRGLQLVTLDTNADPSGLRLVDRSQVAWTSNGNARRVHLPE